MTNQRIKISSIIENQLPQYVKEEFPLVSEFLKQYYLSLETSGGTLDIFQNIDSYVKIDNLTNLIDYAILESDISFFDTNITVKLNSEDSSYGTLGFPDSYGLLLIDDEIITYTSKTDTTFEGCVRGFSGVTSYQNSKDELTFSQSETDEHVAGTKVINLSSLFLKEFFTKIKKQFSPGFENRELYSNLNENLFLKQSIDFYSSKGTDNSFKILFGALYGENVQIIKPRDYLIQASDAQYRITADLVVESIEGDPNNLVNKTLYQDATAYNSAAQGTITKVEKIIRESKEYYIISLDYDYDKDILPSGTVYGKFVIHPKTKLISTAGLNSSTLEVDSTVGFPVKNGNLIADLENGNTLSIKYESKTLNQFLGCSGITEDIKESTEIKSDLFAYSYSEDSLIKIRILGVLSDIEIPNNTRLYSNSDSIRIKTLGIDLEDFKSNNWFFNLPIKYSVINIAPGDTSDNSFKITTKDKHYFKIGDYVTFVPSLDTSLTGTVISYDGEKTFSVVFGSNSDKLDFNLSYYVYKNITKPIFKDYPSVNNFTADVQNVYYDDSTLYVASSSLPNYKNLELSPKNRIVSFTGSFDSEKIITTSEEHGFYTGDSVVYKPSNNDTLGITTGIFFVKVINSKQIKLSRSKDNIFSDILRSSDDYFITLNGSTVDSKLELADFTYRNLESQKLDSQKLIRKLSNPEDDFYLHQTEPGLIGILVNGVEILNYKSKDKVFYGPIETIIPTSSGFNYDVINPPFLTISDPIGFGATGYCSVNGKLERIDILDPGFDYLETPKINITGGNGFGAIAEANLISFNHLVEFNSQNTSGPVKLNPTNTVNFSEYHKFRNFEEIIYITNGQASIGGLTENSSYYVSVLDEYRIKIYKSESDAIVGINTIQLTSYGVGTHAFKSKNKKKKIGSITVKNQGSGYQNKPTSTPSSGINTSTNSIFIQNHGYSSGELIVYEATETPIGGLSSDFSYYVTKINDDEFKLSSTSGVTSTFYYDTKQYIEFVSSGSGTHKFNYPEIKVEVKGRVGISTFTNLNWNAEVQPIFRGEIQSVFLESGGKNYGSEEILNHNRQPTFNLNSGSGAQLTPIISEGKIVDVFINSSGFGYNSIPDIQVIGDGVGAVLVPIISDGTIVEVKINNGGLGYGKENTFIQVISSGRGAKFEAKIKSWNINLVERLIQNLQISNDDGILTTGLNSEYGLQYSHAYAPRSLRELVQSSYLLNGERKYIRDLIFDKKELDSTTHSPIIGWAYDGNPIYGPYGYLNGKVKCLSPGYKLKSQVSDRPRFALYPQGVFVEDYEYVNDGDLDEHNGRFCITPEYPEGVYAYFTTITSTPVESFSNYKKPVFPYIIGNTYKSKPIDFNFSVSSNQDNININDTNWRRNITPYNIKNDINSYEYISNLNKTKSHNSTVKDTFVGKVDNIDIINSGNNYKVNDVIHFDTKFGTGAKAKVSYLSGKPVSEISIATSTFNDVKFYPLNQSYIGYTTQPHNYSNNDLITFTGKFDYNRTGNIEVNYNSLTLTSGIGSANYTGIVTYFNVSGNLNYPNIRENDIYKIGNEEIKVLNIDSKSSRIRVLRNYNNTVGLSSYSSGTILTENPRKFRFNFGISTSYNFNLDRELYFSPKESVGLGTTSGVGITSTLYFSNPGAGNTQITIPTQTIYIENHNLNTGDSLIYSTNNGTPIGVSTNGINSFTLTENQKIYATKISNNLIGISTTKVGLGSFGTIVSVGSTINSGLLYFTSSGSGNNHSFKTNYTNSLSGTISKNTVTVSTAETHGLSLYDTVFVNVSSGIDTTFIVKYNDYNRRIVINPRTFSSIDTIDSSIFISNHGYTTGQKIIYNAITSPVELENNKIYYAIVVDFNNLKLANSYYDAINYNFIDISSTTSGTISPINPPIKVLKNQNLNFDLSDQSLSFINNSNLYSAFDFKFYKDESFSNEYKNVGISSDIFISKIGRIGIDTTSKITLKVADNFSGNLYYNLIPINLNLNNEIKKQIIVDNEVRGFNKINLNQSAFNGEYKVTGITSNTFNYNIVNIPEFESYISNVEYYTNSLSSDGPISKIKIFDGGRYSRLPGISSISTKNGFNSILKVSSNSIGKVKKVIIEDIGYDYSSDYSIRPLAKLPTVLELETLSTFDYIGITSFGRGYSFTPSLVVVDGLAGKVVEDVVLKYSFGDSQVTILKNSGNINNVTPKIIPINNSNGIRINDIVYNDTTKDVVVTLGASFSSIKDFPFFVGEKILIEGISVGVSTTGKGYNSSNYNYNLFIVTNVDPKLGGIGATVTYNLSSYLSENEFPGTFSSAYSAGKIVPQSYFPIFNPVLKKNEFYIGENVSSNSSKGTVEYWDSTNNLIKLSTIDNFYPNNNIIGNTSGSFANIKNTINVSANYKINSFSQRRAGWNKETGFLNNDLQRIHDSDYYQYFSYDLKSNKDISTWNDAVSTLNHTAGFKKFGNLILESKPDDLGISTSQNDGDFSGTVDFSNLIDLNCVNDYDLARENNILIDNKLYSNEIILNSEIIQDYIESVGNRVLTIDDISEQFNSNPRPTEFEVVDRFLLNDFRSKKYIISISDISDKTKKQVSAVSLIYNNDTGFLNQYGLYSNDNLGSFDFNVYGNEGNLTFYPVYAKYNNYHVKLFSFSLNDLISGIGTVNLGNVSSIKTSTVTIPQGTSTSTTIVGIASTTRSFKTLIQISSSDSSYYEYQEITGVYNGTDVYISEYGQLSTDTLASESSSGIGTYNAYISGSNIVLDLIPNQVTSIDYNINALTISLSNSTFSGIGTQKISASKIESNSVSIAASSSPIANQIFSYSNSLYDNSYFIVQVEDKTNLQYQVSEILTISNSNESYINEYGVIQTQNSLGIITSGVSGTNTILYFTPIKDINLDIKLLSLNIGLSLDSGSVSLNNGSLNYDYGSYTGSYNDIKKSFNLLYKNTPIFERYFDASDSNIVKIDENKIRIPYHFFVTGEEVTYKYSELNENQPIGIATTSVPGIGLTDKLPNSLYIVKINDIDIKVAASSSEALRPIPKVLELSSVGVGNLHRFIAKNQNNKALISIDNVIQSPIVSTSITSRLSKNVDVFDSQIFVNNTNYISGGDLIKINNEIMKVNSVGIGSTNSISITRTWLGSGISTHSSNDLVTKIYGNYNIVDNTIYFVEPPYGKVPVLNPSNRPDEIDYIGISTSSSFSGRIFLRSGIQNTLDETYYNNYIFDDISLQFDGSKKDFTLKSQGKNVTGISTNNSILLINDIFQTPSSQFKVYDYSLKENSGITSVSFTGIAKSVSYDVNTASVPRGGIILSVGSSQGFGYQPLVSAGGTAIISIAGTIQSISIGNSGSGYRSGIQTNIRVGVKTDYSNITYVGIASARNGNIVSIAITNPGVGYTFTNPPTVIFDSPLSYSNIPLTYSKNSISGVGTEAVVDIVVGQGSSVISFELKNLGYGYKPNEILTVSIGGSTGIQTTSSANFSEFQISIDSVYYDKFSAWSIGSLQVIDSIEFLFDGQRTIFPISFNNSPTSIRAKKGSIIDSQSIQSSLLVFLNDILQVPGEGYIFKGGSTIKFTEAPKVGDKCSLIFYAGTGDIDTINVDILETIKEGDKVILTSDDSNLIEDERLVEQIISSDNLKTNLYSGFGISNDENLLRPLTWCRQTEDVIINGQQVSKDRVIYEPYIQPETKIIQNISTSSTEIFVESVKGFFDSKKEYIHNGITELPQNKIIIISQDESRSAIGTANVSLAGTISSITLTTNGVGYNTTPVVIISNPVGLGTSCAAKAVCNLTNNSVSSITITNGGIGYTASNPPIVLIESPASKVEVINKVSYEGDYGFITGINTVSVGVASTGIAFDLFIPPDSILRDSKISNVGIATTGISGIQTGYYFTVRNSNIGKGVTSLSSTGSIVGIGTTFLDNVYQAASVSIAQTSVLGIGVTYVAKVVVSLSNYNSLSGFGFSGFYGEYSWGRITTTIRTNPKSFESYAKVGGISTSPIVQRYNRLKYIGYSTS